MIILSKFSNFPDELREHKLSGSDCTWKSQWKNTGKMGKILEKLMKKYWKNAKNTGKVYEKILEKCKKNWKSRGNSSVQKSGNHELFALV